MQELSIKEMEQVGGAGFWKSFKKAFIVVTAVATLPVVAPLIP